MPISLPSTATPRGLRSTYATDEENAAAAEAMQQDAIETNTSFGRGLSRGLYQMPAMMANAAGQIVEPISQPTAQPMFDWAAQQNQAARQLVSSQDVTSYDQVNNPGTLASYVGGAIGENLPNMLATIPLGIAGRVGLRGAAMSPFAKNLAATSAASFPMQMGEMAGSLREDPTIMANTTPMQRLGTSAGYAALTAPMEAADEALLMGRAMGAGKMVKNIFKDGVGATAKSAVGHVAKAIPEAALTEGVPEVGQTFTQQQMLNGLNSERDTSKDKKELGDSFFKGWAAGAGSSVAGRGADVAWAQGRGATEAIRSLLTPKTLPQNLTQSDDKTIVDWDKQDDQQRNETAKDLADKILNSDASQSLKEAATSFYDKASQGASDAWSSLSDALGDNQHVQNATGRLDNFLDAVKKANKNAFGGKFNAESTPEDTAMFEQLTQYLDPKGVAARDTEKKSDLFQGIKGALQAEAWHELPWNELEDEFGTIGRATEAVVKMRENMVRAGQLEHDDEFSKLLDASAKDGQLGERAMMDVVHRYGKEYIGRKPQDSELREVVRGIRNAMQARSSMKPEMIKVFDAEMNKTFGEGNAVKVMQALGPKNVETTEFENDDGEGVKVGDEIDTPKAGFIGSSVQHQRKVAAEGNAESTIANHGGFWRLDKKGASPAEISALKEQVSAAGEAVRTAKAAGRGTANLTKKLNNLTKKLDATMDKTAVQQMRKRYNDTAASLRKGQGADSHYVRSLTPLEYAEAAGIAPSKVAKHLGTTVEGLQDHPARMLMSEPRQLEKDKLSLDKDDIKNLADATQEAVGRMPPSVLLKGSQADAVKAAMKLSGREQRKAMEALGLEHGQRMDDKVANKLVNNWHHGGNGVFTVHMDDGTNHKISAQALIATMRKRAVGEMGDRSALKAFQSGVAALQNIEGFSKITVDSVWGKQQAPAKNSVGKNGKSVANAQYGVFGPYFKLEPGLTLAAANDAATRKGSKAEKEDIALVAEYEKLEDHLKSLYTRETQLRKAGESTEKVGEEIEKAMTRMEDLSERYNEIEEARAMYAGEDQTEAVPGQKGATDDENVTPIDHENEEVRDFNDDGTPKHPPQTATRLTTEDRTLAKAKDKAETLSNKAAKGLATKEEADAAEQKLTELYAQLTDTPVGTEVLNRAPLKFNGVTLQLRPGVSGKDLTGPARKLLSSVRRMRELLGNTSNADIVLNIVAQAAAANHASDAKARDALLAMASDKLVQALADEMVLAQETAQDSEDEAKQMLRERYAELKKLGAEHIALAKKYQANQEAYDQYAASYQPYRGSKPKAGSTFEAAGDRWSHHQQFLATFEGKSDEEITKDGVARKARIEQYEQYSGEKVVDLVKLMREEQALAREELKARKAGTKAQKTESVDAPTRPDPVTAKAGPAAAEREAIDAADEGRRIAAEKHQKEFDAALDEVAPEAEASDTEKLQKNLAEAAKHLRGAWAALKKSYVDGKFDKALVTNLRAAMASFRAAAGDAARIVAQAVQRFIKEYQAAMAATKAAAEFEVGRAMDKARKSSKQTVDGEFYTVKTDAKQLTQFNAEGSSPTGTVTAQDMAEVKDYIAKVLGPKVKVMLAKTLGGNSASWERVNGEALIKIAAKAANPMGKAHHEAMHEFFQRLMDDGSPAADILRQAANSKLVTRQIEQFFHNDPNYAKIKAALAADEHERVAYMFQLWAAGKLKVGPQTKSLFQKIKDWLRKVSGVLSSDQKAEAIMGHFHEGSMSDTNAVAAVLANDPKLIQDLVERSDKLMGPLSEKLQELMYTSQNIMIESGNAGFEKIGRMFSNETGSENKDMSFFDAKTMKTNQMNDRLVQILKGADEKDMAAALEGLQTGKQSNDPKIAAMQQRVRKMLDQIHTYLKDAGVDVAKVKDYFPRAWDVALISDDKAGFIKLLQADHLKSTGKPLSDTIATGIADTLILNRGADPLNEDELEAGYTPFMAAANKRVLDFITDPAFAKFQQQDMAQVLTNYIAQGVHRAEYTRRFGSNGKGLRSMIHDAVGEAVGPEWTVARKAADDKLKALQKTLKTSGATQAKISEALHAQGYRYGEVQTEHIVAELADKTKFNEFEPKLRRNVRAIMAMEGTLGADINPRLRKLSSTLIVYENMRLLGMSLFSQVIDPLGVLVRGGTLNNAFETFKRGIVGTIAAWKGTPMEDKMSELAMKLGIIDASGMMNSQGNAYASVYLGKTAQKWNDRLFRVNGVEGFSQGTRVGAMIAAIEFLKHHSTLPSEHSERWLAELNLKAADIALVGGELDYQNPKIQQALFRWVETAILRPNASMRPAWASDPHFSLIFHMKQFTYAMQKVILERVHNEIKHGNYDPAIAMVLTYVPAMMAADFLRGIAANGGEEPPWKRKWDFGDYLSNSVQRAGLLGVPQFALDVAEWGPGELAGPAAEQVIRAGERLNKDVARDMRLDDVAALTGASRDIQKAEDFNGVSHAAKRTLRDALPINSLTKRYVFDEIAGT